MKTKKTIGVAAALTLAMLFGTSCSKDYSGDIDQLNKRVDNLTTQIQGVQKLVNDGAVITGVSTTDKGISIKLSNGKSYELTNAKEGGSGLVVSINETTGHWIVGGKDTGMSAKGKDGKDGAYFYPGTEGAEKGYWVKVDAEGKKEVTKTSWLPAGTITAVYENGVVTLLNVDGADGKVVITPSQLTGLTMIPTLVGDEGGALPVLNFAPLETTCGYEVAPNVVAKFIVSPSNATEAQINTKDLRVIYNNPEVQTRSAKIDAKAKFLSLKNGIMSVAIEANSAYIDDTANKIDEIMVAVPLKNGGEVHSDWIKVTKDVMSSTKLALVKKVPEKDPSLAWSTRELFKTADAAKAFLKEKKENLKDPRVVELEYSETLDLLPLIKTMLKKNPWIDFDIENPYGLSYSFDLNDESGVTIEFLRGDNKTDQQKFINLNGSKVSTRVYSLGEANPASVDRTPIVHVRLMHNECGVVEGFLPINIIPKKLKPVDDVELTTEAIVAGCKPFELRIGTQRMNEKFYAKAELSKTEFHSTYDWVSTPAGEGVGTIEQVPDEKEAESYNLVWKVSEADIWANLGKTITKEGEYTDGKHLHKIKVIFKATIKQPELSLTSLRLDNMWDAAKTFVRFNVSVPTVGDTNPENDVFDVNINNAFKSTSDKMLDLAAANPEYKNYEYEYKFAPKQPLKTVDGISISVSADHKKLLASDGGAPEVIATILPQEKGKGDILSYNKDSELGKYLLNKDSEFMKARLIVVVKNECHKEFIVKVGTDNSFLVHFLRPVNVRGKASKSFEDGVDFGAEGSYIDINDVVSLSDWRNYIKHTTDYDFLPNHANYYGYYDVQNIVVKDGIVPVGLRVDGKDLKKLPSTIEVNHDKKHYDAATKKFGRLTYKNNGATVEQSFKLLVPIEVEYKWGKVSKVVEVLVKTTEQGKAK